MVSLSSSVSIFSDGLLQVAHPSLITPPSYFRCPHDVERVNWNAKDYRYRGNVDAYKGDLTGGEPRKIYSGDGVQIMKAFPEVYRLKPDHHTVLDCYWQGIWRDLNPMLSDGKWSTLLGNSLAWTNGTGFPDHRNCITGEEPDAPFPRFDAPRACGGAIFKAKRIENGMAWIETLLVTDKSRTASEILASRHLWFWGTSVNPSGEIGLIRRLGIDGSYHPVRVPLVTTIAVYLPLAELHALADGPLPDATWLS
jgi:hypothetical protein